MDPSKDLKNEYTLDEVTNTLKVDVKEVEDFEREGVIDFADKAQKTLNAENFERLKAGLSLKNELGVNLPGIDIILNMRQKMSGMQNEVNGVLGKVKNRLEKTLEADLEEIQNLRKKD